MYNENNNKIRWIAVFTAIVLLFVGVISALAVAIKKNLTAKSKRRIFRAILTPKHPISITRILLPWLLK